MKTISGNKKYDRNCTLVISEPETSEYILRAVLRLAKMYPEMEFHLRRHPQETYSSEQIQRIENTVNVIDVTSKECSQIAILPYENIIGDNSSVLYEAVSIGKKVGRLNCDSLIAIGYKKGKEDGFYYLNNLKDFDSFINLKHNYEKRSYIYSDFDIKLFKRLISN